MAISEKRKIGNTGEDLACQFLMSKGLKIKNRKGVLVLIEHSLILEYIYTKSLFLP